MGSFSIDGDKRLIVALRFSVHLFFFVFSRFDTRVVRSARFWFVGNQIATIRAEESDGWQSVL